MEKVRRYQNGPGVLAAILEAMSDKDARVRWIAVMGLSSFERASQARPGAMIGAYQAAADRVVPALITAVKDSDQRVRQYAMSALRYMGPKGRAGAPTLVEILTSDEDFSNRANAAAALGQTGDDSPAVVTALYSALKDSKHPRIRSVAANALRQIRPVPKQAAERLLETYRMTDIKDPKVAADIRSACVDALVWIRANDPTTLKLLKQIMTDTSAVESERFRVARYLFSLPDERVATFQYMSQWAEQEKAESPKDSVRRQFRELKMQLNKGEP